MDIVIISIILVLVVLAIISIKKHGINRCAGCGGDCKNCIQQEEIKEIFKKIKEE